MLQPLLVVFFTPEAVQLAAPSNKAARLLNGKTLHNLAGLRATDSLKMHALALRKHQDRKKVDATLGKVGALIIDEFSQIQSNLFHGVALRATYSRADRYGLHLSDYARPS